MKILYISTKVLFSIAIVLVFILVVLLFIRLGNQLSIKSKSTKLLENDGISEVVPLDINGVKQYVLIEGKEKRKPIILFLHGGPGQPFPYGVGFRGAHPTITTNYIAVYYDQRGSGKSYNKAISVDSMNIDQFVDDIDEVVTYLKNRFNVDKINLVGMSWGTIIGMEYSKKKPENINAYFGISQFVDNTETQLRSKEWLLNSADYEENTVMKKELTALGEPPYREDKDKTLSKYISQYGGDNYSDKKIRKVSMWGLIKPALVSPDYSLGDLYKAIISGPKLSLLDADALQQEIHQINLRESIKRVEIPVYFFQGSHDKITNYTVMKEYFDLLDAPKGKELITFDHSAHYPNAIDFKSFHDKLDDVLKK